MGLPTIYFCVHITLSEKANLMISIGTVILDIQIFEGTVIFGIKIFLSTRPDPSWYPNFLQVPDPS